MSLADRRCFLWTSVAALAGSASASLSRAAAAPGQLRVAPFRFDVTPPAGHSLCGGWIRPVVAVDDALEAIGFVLLGAGKPVVICAVDWTGILNEAHLRWRQALAAAADTTPDRVAVQSVHQHNAPFACLEAQRIVAAQEDLPPIVDVAFFEQCLERGGQAVREALRQTRPVTHVAASQARVERIASNRRMLGPDGKVQHWRGSSSRNPLHQELPEGLIDPWLKTVAFYDGETQVVAAHYYATHPMSYYGDGRVSSDFVGLARKRRQAEQPDCTHVYFTGCAGNVAAGKYNDGSPQARRELTDRLYRAMVAAEAELRPRAVSAAAWSVREILPPPRESLDADAIEKQIADRSLRVVQRNRPAYMLAWLRRFRRKQPILVSALHLDEVTLLHLPAESFIEYQLRAQRAAPERFVATAAYGDGGPWYIPTAEAYPQGGYEVTVAFCDPRIDGLLSNAACQSCVGLGASP